MRAIPSPGNRGTETQKSLGWQDFRARVREGRSRLEQEVRMERGQVIKGLIVLPKESKLDLSDNGIHQSGD